MTHMHVGDKITWPCKFEHSLGKHYKVMSPKCVFTKSKMATILRDLHSPDTLACGDNKTTWPCKFKHAAGKHYQVMGHVEMPRVCVCVCGGELNVAKKWEMLEVILANFHHVELPPPHTHTPETQHVPVLIQQFSKNKSKKSTFWRKKNAFWRKKSTFCGAFYHIFWFEIKSCFSDYSLIMVKNVIYLYYSLIMAKM